MGRILFHLISAVVLAFMIHLCLHEVGHMLGGMVTGWKLVFLQILYLALIKQNDKLRLKLVRKLGFQCIMYPKYMNQEASLYTLSGCIMNLILTVQSLSVMLLSVNNYILWLYSWSFFAVGVGMLIMNAIPSTKRLCNDMACYLLLKKDSSTRCSHNAQMMIAKMLMKGYSFGEVDEKLICLPGKLANNDILAYHAVLEYYYWLEKGEIKHMKEALQKIEYGAPISRSVLNIIYLEKLYSDLVIKLKEKDYTEPDKVSYGGNLKEFINIHKAKGDVHSIRVEAVLKAFMWSIKKNHNQAMDAINKGITCVNNLPLVYTGEAVFCLRQLLQLKSSL